MKISPLGFVSAIMLTLIIFYSCKHQPIEMIDDPADTTGNNNPPVIACNPDTVYFQNTILPIIQAACAAAGCHDAETHAGDLIFNNYNNIITTGNIEAFNPSHGKFYESLIDADPDKVMPPPPLNKLDSTRIALIYKWIMQGAKNNHCDECDTVDVTYNQDIKNILENYCYACHTGTDPVGVFTLSNYDSLHVRVQSLQLMGALSHLQGYSPMPNENTFLPACEINKIQTWINHGAPNN